MLNVYRASAGSGKTHLLTGYYLSLLLRKDWWPQDYDGAQTKPGHHLQFEEVLAVTFTNKATAEMKERIIEQLDILARTPLQSDYYQQLTDHDPHTETDASRPKELAKAASELLFNILGDYSEFNISTIDRFFQRIVRAFMRELDLPSGYEVQLDERTVLEAAVGVFLDQLDAGIDPQTGRQRDDYRWVRRFSRDCIRNGRSWDVQKALVDLAEQLTNETYQRHAHHVREFTADKTRLSAYLDRLKGMQALFEKTAREIGEEAIVWIEGNIPGGYEYFVQKHSNRSVLYQFDRLAAFDPQKKKTLDPLKPDFLAWADDATLWFGKKGAPQGFEPHHTDALKQRMRMVVELMGEPLRTYNSIAVILSNFYQLGILADLDRSLQQYCSEQGIVLLGPTNALLGRLVEGQEAPFVYAKVGARIRDYMIDEFQDTSNMQWHNFRPLIAESNAARQRNLIVGDVKQSIYRWRGSDWSLLQDGLKRDFKRLLLNPSEAQIAASDPEMTIDTQTLRTNWRSRPGIVWFNNHFFPMAASHMAHNLADTSETAAQTVTDIYSDVTQEYRPKTHPSRDPGLVRIEFIPVEKKKRSAEEGDDAEEPQDYDTLAAKRIPETVRQLIESGYAPNEIAVLGRTNGQCKLAAEALIAQGYSIISNKALRMDANPAIICIIAMMRHLQHLHDKVIAAEANILLIAMERGVSMAQAMNAYFTAPQTPERLDALAGKPLYELCEELIRLLPHQAQEEHHAYLLALRDAVLQFTTSRSADLSAFLTWWDEAGHKGTIATPQSADAIQIMTIHQSKGLGMPAIIYPFTLGSLDIDNGRKGGMKADLLWCAPTDRSLWFNQDEQQQEPDVIFPIPISKGLKHTSFSEDYAKERLCSIIDNLNTAYVAMTRAKEAMIIYTQDCDVSEETNLYSLEQLLCRFRDNLPLELDDDAPVADLRIDSIELGQWQRAHSKKEEPTLLSAAPERSLDDLFEPESFFIPLTGLPILSMHQTRLAQDDDAVLRGNTMHERLENIRTLADIQDDDLRAIVQASDLTASWFADDLLVLNEASIVLPSGIQKRPDRIVIRRPKGEPADMPLDPKNCELTVIDYKTTRLPAGSEYKEEHLRQVQIYMSHLRRMGFRKVKGYLWYLEGPTTYEVRLDTTRRRPAAEYEG